MSLLTLPTEGTVIATDRRGEIERWARSFVNASGAFRQKIRLNAASHLPMTSFTEAARWHERHVSGTVEEAKRHVEDGVRMCIRTMVEWLALRGCDPTFGVEVVGCIDLRKALPFVGPNRWTPDMGHYAVVLEWIGPRPATWPHKVTPEDLDPSLLKTDDAGYISDYRKLDPEAWDQAVEIMRGGRLLKREAVVLANEAPLPNLGETA